MKNPVPCPCGGADHRHGRGDLCVKVDSAARFLLVNRRLPLRVVALRDRRHVSGVITTRASSPNGLPRGELRKPLLGELCAATEDGVITQERGRRRQNAPHDHTERFVTSARIAISIPSE